LSFGRQCLEDSVYKLPGSQGERLVSRSDYNTLLPKVSVVIPALNEARNLPHVFAKLPGGLHEVIVVDGNSVDDTTATATSGSLYRIVPERATPWRAALRRRPAIS
jgi:hypothetical protein